jgi:hypothetical protein
MNQMYNLGFIVWGSYIVDRSQSTDGKLRSGIGMGPGGSLGEGGSWGGPRTGGKNKGRSVPSSADILYLRR